MERLTRKYLKDHKIPEGVTIGNTAQLTEKVLQFGEGNFLRAFVDYLIDELNAHQLFQGSVTVVQPIPQGMVELLNQQDGLYTLITRGLQNNQIVNEKRIVTSVTHGINPYTQFSDYMDCIKNPELRFIVSNTTESGITFNENDCLADTPPSSFPAKITALLYERYRLFQGDPTKGFILIPCELIDYNGTMLKKIVLQYAQLWKLEADFVHWIEEANYFTNTLVDRIVTGYPRDEVAAITEEMGYEDQLIDTAEIFYLFVIEAPEKIRGELPFEQLKMNVIWTDDATNYKLRKVRILNGGHTMSVLLAYLAGKNTVGEMMSDPDFKTFLTKGIFDEVIPTLALPYEDLKQFADDVFERFSNPYIKHSLLSISLNSVSKFKTRVLPTMLDYIQLKNALPKYLTLSFASLIAFYRGSEIQDNALIGTRGTDSYKIMDDLSVLEFFQQLWSSVDTSNKDALKRIVLHVCEEKSFWGQDLSQINGFADQVAQDLWVLLNRGAANGVKDVL